jgi:hypothetical protein
MTTEILEQARCRGIELSVSPEGNLRCRSRGPLPVDLRQTLVAHKAELLKLLRSASRPAALDPDDAYEWFAERAAIMEYDGGLDRVEAEWFALAELLKMYFQR